MVAAEPTGQIAEEALQKIIAVCSDENHHYDDLEAREECWIIACRALGLPNPLGEEGEEWEPVEDEDDGN